MKKSLIFFSVVLVCAACNKQIDDIKPLTQIDASGQLGSVQGIQQATNGNYTLLGSAVNGTGLTSYDLAINDITETRGNNEKLATWGTSGQLTDAFFFQNTLRPAAGYGAIVYKGSYQVITSSNVTLEGIASFSAANFSSLTPADQSSLLYAEGENRFLRAMVYFNLVNIFGKPYYLASGGDLAVAIKKTGSATEIPEKSSVKDLYAYIVAELRAAAQLMKAPVVKTNAFASTGACWALLSRVYLYMGGSVANPDASANQLAVSYADSVTDQSNGLYGLAQGTAYSNLFGDDSQGQLGKSKSFSTNPEIVFCKDNSTGGNAIDILYHFFPDAGAGGTFLPSSDLLYQYVANDVRGSFFMVNAATGFTESTKWDCLNQGGLTFGPQIFLRMGEVYLNRAEANAKLGNMTQARADLKAVHVRAGLPGSDIDNLADNAVLAAVLKERRLELAFEGQNSFDYFRNGLPMTRTAADFNGTTLTVQPTDATVVFPTPIF